MQKSDDQEFESYVPVYDVVPEKWEDARIFLVEQLKRISNAVNVREIGFFTDEEVLAGKFFIPGVNIATGDGNSQQFRTVLRKVIDFGALPNGAPPFKSIPHGITFDNNFTLTFIGAYATDPVSFLAIPIPFTDTNATANQISLEMDSTDVTIRVGMDQSNFTRCFVTIEFIQEL